MNVIEEDRKPLFAYDGPCLLHHGGSFGRDGEPLSGVHVGMGEYAQYDQVIWVHAYHPKKPRQRKQRSTTYIIRPDGLDAMQVEIGGKIVWDSKDVYPVYPSMEAAQAASNDYHEIMLRSIRQEITAEQFAEEFRQHVEEYRRLYPAREPMRLLRRTSV